MTTATKKKVVELTAAAVTKAVGSVEGLEIVTAGDATVTADTDRKWRKKYSGDGRLLCKVKLGHDLASLSCKLMRLGHTGDGTARLAEKTEEPLFQFPNEIRVLMDRLTVYALRVCDLPDTDRAITDVTGVTITHSSDPGGIPKVSFTMRREVLKEFNYMTLNSKPVYMTASEGSVLVLPEGGDRIIESLRLHCMRAVDGEFDKPIRQTSLFDPPAEAPALPPSDLPVIETDSTAESSQPEAEPVETMFDA